MPTLDDIPILQRVTPAGDDLIPISDPNGTGSSKVRAIALNQINGLNAGEITTVASAASLTISTRVTVVTGTTQASTLTLPAASGALRELFIINDVTTAALTLPTLAAGTEAIAATTSAHLLSNGTGWYRV
jgi:hypothetical protein